MKNRNMLYRIRMREDLNGGRQFYAQRKSWLMWHDIECGYYCFNRDEAYEKIMQDVSYWRSTVAVSFTVIEEFTIPLIKP